MEIPDMQDALSIDSAAPGDGDFFAFPLSPEQERMWHAYQESSRDPAYNAAFRWRLEGPIDYVVLQRTFNEIVRRHEVLRARIDLIDGVPRLILADSFQLPIAVTDLSAVAAADRELSMDDRCAVEATRSFDLQTGPLIRVGLIRLKADSHVLTITMHHIICDGWSIRVIMDDLKQIYPALAAGRDPALPDLAIQYSDYVLWQRECLERGDHREQLAYWSNKLSRYRALSVPSDAPAPGKRIANSAIHAVELPRELSDKLRQFSNSQGGTMFSTTLAACVLLLHRYTGETDIAVGSHVAGRNRIELEGLVGLVANPIVLRVNVGPSPRFAEFAASVRGEVWQAIANQDVPFAEILRTLERAGESCPRPFYRVNFICQRAFGGGASGSEFDISGIKVTAIPSKPQGALYDLNFFMVERQTGWRLSLEYNTDLYSDAAAQQILDDYRAIVETIAADPDRGLAEFPVSRSPGLVPLTDGDGLPARLPEQRPLQAAPAAQPVDIADPEDADADYALPAGVTQERFWLLSKISPDGSAFNMPASVRITGRLSVEALAKGLRFIIDRHEILRTAFEEVDGKLVQKIRARQEFPLAVTSLDDVPKEMQEGKLKPLLRQEARKSFDLEHGPLCRAALFRLGPEDHVLMITLHHIVSDGWSQGLLQRELWSCYRAIGENLLPSLPQLEVQYADFTVWQNAWLDTEAAKGHLGFWLQQLRPPLPILDLVPAPHAKGGEQRASAQVLQLSQDLIARLKGWGQSQNATMFMVMLAGFAALLSRYSGHDDVLIGSPAANRRAETEPLIGPFSVPFALRLKLSPKATLRDALAHAVQVMLDAMEHVELPFEVVFSQLKARSVHGRNPLFQFYFVYQSAFLQPYQMPGLSIAPLAAESVGIPFELQLAVIERADGVRATLDYDPRRFDARQVCDMLGYYEYVLSELVSNPDQPIASLRAPIGALGGVEAATAGALAPRDYVAPRNSVESRLAAIWEQLFELPRIGMHDDFFDLGGQSILAAKLASRVEKEFGQRIDLSTLSVKRTIEQLAAALTGDRMASESSSVVGFRPSGTRPPLFLVHGGGGHVLSYQDVVDALPSDQPVFGLSAPELDGAQRSMSIKELASAYVRDIRAVQKRGPYQIGGYSFGGLVAYEMATQLESAGDEVSLLVILDTSNRAYYANLPFAQWLQFWSSFLAERLRRYRDRLQRRRFDVAAFSMGYFIFKSVRWRAWRIASQIFRTANAPMPKPLRDNIIMFTITARNFDPQPFNGRVVLFRSYGLGPEYGHNISLGWEQVARGGVAVHSVPGDHRSFMTGANARHLVAHLDRYLAR